MEECQVHLPELEFVYNIVSFGYLMVISLTTDGHSAL